jgi:hypothetical protein
MRGGLLHLPTERDLGNGYTLRLLSAWEELECRREGEELAQEDRDRALCANACLLAHALYRGDRPAFESGQEVLEGLTAGQIGDLARRWGEFDRECDPAPWDEKAVDEAKKDWSTRLASAFSGVCSRLLEPFPPRNE